MAVNPVAVIRNNKGWLLQCGDDHPHTLFAVQKFIWWPDQPIIQGWLSNPSCAHNYCKLPTYDLRAYYRG